VAVAIAAALLAAAAPTRAYDLAEAALRRVETARLGAEHAAAHAAQRQLAREAPAAGARSAPPTPLPPVPPQTGGAWAPAAPIPVIAINAALLRLARC
jgi:hypothetical protein